MNRSSCDRPDSMNIPTNCVTITNDRPQNFYDGRVRFVLRRGDYSRVTNGDLLARYDCSDNSTALLVRVNIRANGKVTVTVPSYLKED